jgi:hypothetical protein
VTGPAVYAGQINQRKRAAQPSDEGRRCRGREAVAGSSGRNDFEVKATWPRTISRRGNEQNSNRRNRHRPTGGLAGADTVTIVFLSRSLVVMVGGFGIRFIGRPRGLFGARVRGINRQPGSSGRGDEQHEGRESGSEAMECHKGESSYVAGRDQDSGGVRQSGPTASPS